MSDERCAACGRETSAGSSLFAGRERARNTETGEMVYVCGSCVDGATAPGSKRSDWRLGVFELSDTFRR
jgi:hypothetical protein